MIRGDDCSEWQSHIEAAGRQGTNAYNYSVLDVCIIHLNHAAASQTEVLAGHLILHDSVAAHGNLPVCVACYRTQSRVYFFI